MNEFIHSSNSKKEKRIGRELVRQFLSVFSHILAQYRQPNNIERTAVRTFGPPISELNNTSTV